MLNTSFGHCVNWTQKYANPSCSFLWWTVFVVYLIGRVWDPQLFWCC